jgi:uncharacterized protein
MALSINVRQLEQKSELELEGSLAPLELELENVDELIRVSGPVTYDLEAQIMEKAILVEGPVHLTLACECARCLKAFEICLNLDWVCHIPLEGEDKAEVINDVVDLTPYLREDILLAFPQRPLCEKECAGLPDQAAKTSGRGEGAGPSPWAELNKLKF